MEILNFPTWDTTNGIWLVAIFPDKYPWNKELQTNSSPPAMTANNQTHHHPRRRHHHHHQQQQQQQQQQNKMSSRSVQEAEVLAVKLILKIPMDPIAGRRVKQIHRPKTNQTLLKDVEEHCKYTQLTMDKKNLE